MPQRRRRRLIPFQTNRISYYSDIHRNVAI